MENKEMSGIKYFIILILIALLGKCTGVMGQENSLMQVNNDTVVDSRVIDNYSF